MRGKAVSVWTVTFAGLAVLSGCVSTPQDGVSKASHTPGLTATMNTGEAGLASPIIQILAAKSSVLATGSAMDQVADAVLATYAGTEATQLRVARLKAEARAQNWLPKVGPSVSLSALQGLAAGLSVEHALFDNGRRQAERDFAAADVDVSAVSLSAEVNSRVYDGLSYFIRAEQARQQASVARMAVEKLGSYALIMDQRVAGGISDRSEISALNQRLAEMQAIAMNDDQTETNARTALAAMVGSGSVVSLPHTGDGIGLQAVPAADALSVLRAKAEGTRAIAEAKAGRAGLLPGLNGAVSVTARGIDPGVNLGGAFGAGTKAELDALAATPELVSRRNAVAAEKAHQRVVMLENQIATLQTRQGQAGAILRQTESNLDLFTEQYKLGRRTLLELAGQFDSYARLKREHVSLDYEIVLLRLEIARDRGLLVDGSRL